MDILSIVIAALGVLDLGILILLGGKFQALLMDFKSVEHRKTEYREEYKKGGNLSTNSLVEIEYDRVRLEELRRSYHGLYSWYGVFSQLVAVFPLLGILGTVMGLVTGGELADVEKLVAGLTTALTTTLVGLICSIILKLVDSFWPGKMVTDLELRFDTIDAEIQRQSLEKILKGGV